MHWAARSRSVHGRSRAPRGDIDLNLWVSPGDLDRSFEYRVDVFVPSFPFYDEALARITLVGFADRTVPVLSPETLAVFKMLFFRAKDLVDVARLLEIQGDRFDAAFVRRSLADMLGEDDERIVKWDRLTGST